MRKDPKIFIKYLDNIKNKINDQNKQYKFTDDIVIQTENGREAIDKAIDKLKN